MTKSKVKRSVAFSALLLVLLFISLAASSAVPYARAELPAQTPPIGQTTDQFCKTPDTTPGGQIPVTGDEPIGQWFTPTQTPITGFSIYITVTSQTDIPMTARILDRNKNVIGSVGLTIPSGSQSYWYSGSFGTPITVTPGSQYALDLQFPGGGAGVLWWACSDTTPQWVANPGYVQGSNGDSAFAFYEYSNASTPPPPTQIGDFSLTASADSFIGSRCRKPGLAQTLDTYIYVNPIGLFSSPVTLTASSASGFLENFSFDPGSTVTPPYAKVHAHFTVGTMSQLGTYTTALGDYAITVTGTGGGITRTVTITVNTEPDFVPSFSPGYPSKISTTPGTIITTNILTTFAMAPVGGPVTLSYNVTQPPLYLVPVESITADISPTIVGETSTSTVIVDIMSGTPPGNYVMSFTETNNCRTDYLPLLITVNANAAPDFSLATSQDVTGYLPVTTGGMATMNVIVTPIDGFSSPVALSTTWIGNGSPGSGLTVSPLPTVIPPATTPLTVTAQADALQGVANLQITGIGGGKEHTITIPVQINPNMNVPDFTLTTLKAFSTAPQPFVSVYAGSTDTSISVIVNPINGFNSPVTLGTEWIGGAPIGVVVSIAPSATPSVRTTLTITTQPGAMTGDYTLQITGSSGSILRTTRIPVQIIAYQNPPPPKCIIATATYGSELAAPVQFLRSFRDNEVQKTALGAIFLQAFNNWYYSWAPEIAQRIASNENYKATTRAIIAPIIGSLFVAHTLFSVLVPLSPELAILSAGLLASALIGLAYLTPVYALTWKLSKRRITRRTIYGLAVAAAALTFLATLTTGTFSVATNLTALTVVETLLLAPALVMRKISQL